MTGRAARHHFFAADLIIHLQLIAVFLVDITVLPLHIKDLFLGPDKVFRGTMASDAPFHLQCVFLKNCRHIIDLAMAGRAADTLGNMDAVIKVGKFRQIVNLLPFYRLVCPVTFTNRLQIRAIRPNLAVTVHTGLRRRYPGGI